MNAKTSRRQFNRSERIDLYLTSQGKCALCGIDLKTGWHADHYIPFASGGVTSVTNGRSLCPSCNLKKGSRLSMLAYTPRAFQNRFMDVVTNRLVKLKEATVAGQRLGLAEKTIVCHIAPASGKTLMSWLGINQAWLQGEIDTVAAFAPRINLTGQGEDSWTDYVKTHPNEKLMGKITRVNNNPPLLRTTDQFGYISTYASLVASPALHLDFFKRHSKRIALILDEAQSLGFDQDNNSGTKAATEVLQLAEYAALIILMSGTPYRSDGLPLILANYTEPDENGRIHLIADVSASYMDGVRDGYIRPLDAELKNADVAEFHLTTLTVDQTSVDEMDKGLRRVLIHPDFYQPLVERAVEKVIELQQSWDHYCGLIGAVDQDHAREIQRYLKQCYPDLKTLLAISDDAAAQNNLKLFKQGKYDFLITVGMAFLGFDHKEISVICCLSSVRDRSWLRQFFARGMRMADTGDPELNNIQRVYIIAPNDPKMQEVVESLRLESEQGLLARSFIQATTGSATASKAARIIVTDVTMTDGIALGLDPSSDVSQEEFSALDAMRKRHKIGSSVTAIKGLLNEVLKTPGYVSPGPAASSVQTEMAQPDATKTDRETEIELRRKIQGYREYIDHLPGTPDNAAWHDIFHAIEDHLGHKLQTLDDCWGALKWLETKWGALPKQQSNR